MAAEVGGSFLDPQKKLGLKVPKQISGLVTPPEKSAADQSAKSMLNREGKYLTFGVADQEYGIDIHKIREIAAMMDIRSIPRMPSYMRGVVNLRGRVIPVIDLKDKFGMGIMEQSARSCIIVLDLDLTRKGHLVGQAVDSVSEVLAIKSGDIEPTPAFGAGVNTSHIMAMAKLEESVKLLLDIDYVLYTDDLAGVKASAA